MQYSKPKFAFEITEEQQQRAWKVFDTYGLRKAIFSPILDEVMDMIEEHGHLVVAILLDRSIKNRGIIPSLAKTEKTAKKISKG